MDVRARITAQLAFLGGLTTLLSLAAPLGGVPLFVLAAINFLWMALTVTAELMTESPSKRPSLRKLFATRGVGRRYRRIIHRPAHWPRDWRMYDWALRLAVAYPLAFALGSWALGGAVEMGGVVLIPAEPEGWRRAVAIATAAFFGALFFSSFWISGSIRDLLLDCFPQRQIVRRSATLIYFGAALAVGFFSLASARAIIEGVNPPSSVIAALLLVFTIALATSFGLDGVFSVVAAIVTGAAIVGEAENWAIIFLFALAIVIVPLRPRLSSRFRYPIGAYYFFATLAGGVAIGLASQKAVWATENDARRMAFLFFGVLPLLNAVFDYLSYLVTFTLLRWGYRRPRWAAALGLVDLAVALVLFLLSGAGIVLAIRLVNHLAGVPLFPILPLIEGIRAEPSAYAWVYLMLFSTLLPTVAHLGVGMFSLGALLPPGARDRLRAGIGAEDAWPATLTPLLIGAYWTACLVVPLLILAGLGWAFATLVFPHPFAAYLDGLRAVAEWPVSFPAR